MKINEKVVAVFLIGLFLLGIPIVKSMGLWQTESSKVPVTMVVEGKEVYNPEDIRGSYGFSDVSASFEIPIEVLGEAFEVPAEIDVESLLNKDLEAMITTDEEVEVGNGSVKLFVAFYKDLPYDFINADDYLPKHAVVMLKALDHLSQEQIAYLETHTATIHWGEAVVDEHEVTGELEIKGNTTFNEVMAFGVSEAEIESVLGGSFLSNENIKNYCLEHELSFSEIKLALLELIE